MGQRLRFNRTGRYTFIFNDPATAKRVLQYRGSRVGARLLSKTFSAPVVVTSKEGKTLTLVSIFNKRLSARVKQTMTMRIVPEEPRRDALGRHALGRDLTPTTERRRGPNRPPSQFPIPRPPRRSGAGGSCYIIPPPMPMPPMFGLMAMPPPPPPPSSGLSATTPRW